MGHNITAIILKGNYDNIKAEKFGLFGKELNFDLTIFHINHFQTACWQFELNTKGYLDIPFKENLIFPTEVAIAEVIKMISIQETQLYAIIQTEYFGGVGNQHAAIFDYNKNLDINATKINDVLDYLGVVKEKHLDEFDTIGLNKIRYQHNMLDKYIDLAKKYGV